VLQSDGLWLRLIAPPSLSERLCSLVPESTVATDWSNTVFSATREYDPSGSVWAHSFGEAHVMDARLSQTALDSAVRSWDLRVGRGGFIYSLRTPMLGETVPPSWRDPDGEYGADMSPWNDEVWQAVAVSRELNSPPDARYFLHQSGAYMRDPAQSEPFYSPQVASHLSEAERSFTTVNWTPQAHVDIYTDEAVTNDWRSYLLVYTRYRDMGQGVIEASLGLYNYGPDLLDHFNTPWGGVRRTSTEYCFVSEPGGTNWWGPITNHWGSNLDFNETGGWQGFSATSNGVTPALGLVVGQDAKPKLPSQYNFSRLHWGYAGGQPTGNEADWRNFLVASTSRRYNLEQGNGFWSRHYYAFGDDLTDLSSRIAERNLVQSELRAFDYTEETTPLVAYSVSGSGSTFQCMEDGTSPDFFLYAHPVTGSFPVFEIIEDDDFRYLTWNPYANGIIKPYDGTIAGMRLLGFAMPSSGTNGTYAALSGLLPAENFIADGETLFARTATPIETWRVEHFGLTDNAGDAADTADVEPDGLDNLMEYALGGNPVHHDAEAVLPVFQTSENYFYYVHNERTDDPSLMYTVLQCTNLVSDTWTTNGMETSGEAGWSPVWKTVTNRAVITDNVKFIKLSVEK
jgi:hypothetical protein